MINISFIKFVQNIIFLVLILNKHVTFVVVKVLKYSKKKNLQISISNQDSIEIIA